MTYKATCSTYCHYILQFYILYILVRWLLRFLSTILELSYVNKSKQHIIISRDHMTNVIQGDVKSGQISYIKPQQPVLSLSVCKFVTMIYILLPAFFLPSSGVADPSSKCSLQGVLDQPAFTSNGDITIGGIFPLHYRMELPKTDYRIKPLVAQCQG